MNALHLPSLKNHSIFVEHTTGDVSYVNVQSDVPRDGLRRSSKSDEKHISHDDRKRLPSSVSGNQFIVVPWFPTSAGNDMGENRKVNSSTYSGRNPAAGGGGATIAEGFEYPTTSAESGVELRTLQNSAYCPISWPRDCGCSFTTQTLYSGILAVGARARCSRTRLLSGSLRTGVSPRMHPTRRTE